MSPPLLSLRRVVVQFGDQFRAVDRVTLDLGGGELLGLIGPNGAGKTTLLRVAAGLQPADCGEVHLMGQPLDRREGGQLAQLGFTPDTPPVYEKLTVRAFLRFVAKGYGLARGEADERIDFWLDKVWLAEKADAKISALSRGMRQRVGVARTLMPNPAVVLLDEPAAGLDPAGRVQFRRLLDELRRQGKAVVVSSHILADMPEYCTHIGIMSAGRIVRHGTVREVAEGAAADATRARHRVRLADEIADLDRRVAHLTDVSLIERDGRDLTVETGVGDAAAAELLRALVTAGLPVVSFAPQHGDLEGAYLAAGMRQVD